ncbi:MAG: 1-deoxy-D-xylulose 5-phosphate reductoisomerase [Chlamydiae bacterium]|nr:1-deoxy-D-xylulose 5-phosphate reductoisomerase [Chlamydiota bacterium]
MKKIAILGSTGSIGTQTLDVVRQHFDIFQVIALVANHNIESLEKQIEEFRPQFVVVGDREKGAILQSRVDVEVLLGEENISQAATHGEVDLVINALVGKAGLLPTIEAIKLSKQIGLANKETLVLAGELVMRLSQEYNAPIIPIDSEHSAIFQSLQSGRPSEVKRVILTMGKGPIAKMSKEELRAVTMKDILNRPSWDMGMKINVDSATCINKTFEVIEAKWLFDLPPEKIAIVVHPEYLCHSLVEFTDGSLITELGTPDMKRYIQYALFYPERTTTPCNSFLDLFGQSITFEKPPFEKFPCLSMGHEAISHSGTMPAALHGADTSAVKAFMEKKISFTDIGEIIQKTLSAHTNQHNCSLEEILEAEKWAEGFASKLVEQLS